MTREGITAYDLIRTNREGINRELSAVDQARRSGTNANLFPEILSGIGQETIASTLSGLTIIKNPRFILAAETGEHLDGDITKTHEQLLTEWNNERKRQNLPEIPRLRVGSVISGISFQLRHNQAGDARYVRLDQDSREWEELPKYAQGLISGGFTVVDAYYKRIALDVDYKVWWGNRNDI